MKSLKLTQDLPYFSAMDRTGQQIVFIGGLPTAELSEDQIDFLTKGYKDLFQPTEIKEKLLGIEDLKEHQKVETLKALDDTVNISTSETGKVAPASSKTMSAIVAGVTPTVKIPAK